MIEELLKIQQSIHNILRSWRGAFFDRHTSRYDFIYQAVERSRQHLYNEIYDKIQEQITWERDFVDRLRTEVDTQTQEGK